MQQRKKARVSVGVSKSANSLGHSPSASSNSDEDEIPQDMADDTPAMTQYEAERDHWSEDFGVQTQAQDDASAARKLEASRLRRQTNRLGDNVASDNAIIEEIVCQNFMCHSWMNVELGPLINFIVGENGSGKSAVLTAITLCLGGKASATNRGSSLKSLIKEGQDKAILRVKLKNAGVDAYQRELYGDAIFIERQFTTSGTSGFKLKNAAGHTVSTKKGDVDDMIEYYQLQVDNPMNVLTQDAAKSFIQSSTPKQKYQFFVQGVQLQQLDNDYRLVSDTIDQIESKLLDSKDNIAILKKEWDDHEAKAKVADEHKEMRTKVAIMGKQLAWAQVEDQERILVEREREARKAEENIMHGEKAIEEKSEAYRLTNDAWERAETNVKHMQEKLVPFSEEEEAARDAHNSASADVRGAYSEQKLIKANLDNAQRLVESCERDVDTERQRIEDVNGGAPGRKQAEIREADTILTQAKETLALHEGTRADLEKAHTTANEAVSKLEHPLRSKAAEVDDFRRRLQNLQQTRGADMAGYDHSVAALVKRIRSDKGWRETPLGPIGLHCKLLKPEWSTLVESVLGQVLGGFVVTSKQDQVRLSKMMQEARYQAQILIGNHHFNNTAIIEPDPQFETILRILEIDNELIKRQLIIVSSIDQSILIRSRSEGQRVMFDGPRLQNVRACYTLHDSKKDWGHRLTLTGGSTETTGVRLVLGKAPKMKTDIESQISLQKGYLDQAEAEKKQLTDRIRVLKQNTKQCEDAIRHYNSEHNKLKIRVQRAQERLDKLQEEFDSVNITDGALDAYEAALQVALQDQRRLEDDYGNQVLRKEELNKVSLEKKRELAAVKLRVQEQTTKLDKATAKLQNCMRARNMAVTEKNIAVESIETLRKMKAKAGQALEAQEKEVEEFITQATAHSGERIPIETGETYATLEAKYAAFRRRVKEHNKKQGGSDHEIYQRRNEARSRYEQSEKYFRGMHELLALLKASFKQRMIMFRYFRRHISSRSRIMFNYLLSERAFRGALSIDHKHKMLDVRVEPDDTKKSGKGRNTKTLSGGEKSFSSICLLLSLWEAMGAPLRCLDEYDVFMDDVNRDVSARMIVSFH